MSTLCAFQEFDKKAETKNIICCLQFLVNEAEDSYLPVISKIIGDSIAQIVNLDAHQQQRDIDRDFADVIGASRQTVELDWRAARAWLNVEMTK